MPDLPRLIGIALSAVVIGYAAFLHFQNVDNWIA
jgi:hypothetical protein